MNIPNKITLSRIFLIPLFIVVLSVPFNWGELSIGESYLPVTHLVAAIIFIIAAINIPCAKFIL